MKKRSSDTSSKRTISVLAPEVSDLTHEIKNEGDDAPECHQRVKHIWPASEKPSHTLWVIGAYSQPEFENEVDDDEDVDDQLDHDENWVGWR